MKELRELATHTLGKTFAEKVSDDHLIHYIIPMHELLFNDAETVLRKHLGDIKIIKQENKYVVDSETLGGAYKIWNATGKYDSFFSLIPECKSTIMQYIEAPSDNSFLNVPFFKRLFFKKIGQYYCDSYAITLKERLSTWFINSFLDAEEFTLLYRSWRKIVPATYLSVMCTESELNEVYLDLGQKIYNLSSDVVGQLTKGIQYIEVADVLGDGTKKYCVFWFGFLRSNLAFAIDELHKNELKPNLVFNFLDYITLEGGVGPYFTVDPATKYKIETITLGSTKPFDHQELFKNGSYLDDESLQKSLEFAKKTRKDNQ